MESDLLFILVEMHYEFGLIGLDEFVERCQVAEWLREGADIVDPREPSAAERDLAEPYAEGDIAESRSVETNSNALDDGLLKFFWSGWFFTRQDKDPYPSTPHGHWCSPDASWPKLNPYTGRVFRAKHKEENIRRLTKKELISLWSDMNFRNFCRSHVVWYREAFPYHNFGVRYPLRFPKPWR